MAAMVSANHTLESWGKLMRHLSKEELIDLTFQYKTLICEHYHEVQQCISDLEERLPLVDTGRSSELSELALDRYIKAKKEQGE